MRISWKYLISRRLVGLLLFLVFVTVIGLGIHYSPQWLWIVDNELKLREYVASNPIRSWCIGLVTYFAISLIPGTGGKSVVCGWLFGFWQALLIVELGLTSAAIVSFLIGRFFWSAAVNRKWEHRLLSIGRRYVHDGASYLLLLRLAHAPFTLVNYGSGAIKVRLYSFCWTTLLGILPGTIVFTFVGTRIPSLRIVAEQGVWSLIDLPLFAALLATAILPLILRLLARSLAKRIHQSHAVNPNEITDVVEGAKACHQ
jgi:uncharacterized membrane protein YdjX (TVP38/TMEM64 family)